MGEPRPLRRHVLDGADVPQAHPVPLRPRPRRLAARHRLPQPEQDRAPRRPAAPRAVRAVSPAFPAGDGRGAVRSAGEPVQRGAKRAVRRAAPGDVPEQPWEVDAADGGRSQVSTSSRAEWAEEQAVDRLGLGVGDRWTSKRT